MDKRTLNNRRKGMEFMKLYLPKGGEVGAAQGPRNEVPITSGTERGRPQQPAARRPLELGTHLAPILKATPSILCH